MRSSPLHHWPLLIGILPILMLCATSDRAQAGCGDYLHIVPTHGAAPAPDAPHSPAKPCSGPSCQKSPIIPTPMPIPTPTNPVQTLDAILTAVVEVSALQGILRIDLADAGARPGHLETIFHPPR